MDRHAVAPPLIGAYLRFRDVRATRLVFLHMAFSPPTRRPLASACTKVSAYRPQSSGWSRSLPRVPRLLVEQCLYPSEIVLDICVDICCPSVQKPMRLGTLGTSYQVVPRASESLGRVVGIARGALVDLVRAFLGPFSEVQLFKQSRLRTKCHAFAEHAFGLWDIRKHVFDRARGGNIGRPEKLQDYPKHRMLTTIVSCPVVAGRAWPSR